MDSRLWRVLLCQLDHTRRDIVESGAIQACIRALERFQTHPGVHAAGCIVIGLLWSVPDVRKAVVDGGGLKAVTDTMQDYPLDGDIQQRGCYALFCLLSGESSWAESAVDIGCIEAVICAMENLRDDPKVQEFGCQFLCALAKSHNGRAYYKRIVAAKGLVAVVEALRIHKDNAIVVRVAGNANQAILDAAAPPSSSSAP